MLAAGRAPGVPPGRLGTPDKVAIAIAVLALNAAARILGGDIVIDSDNRLHPDRRPDHP